MIKLDTELFDTINQDTITSPRHRMNYDLRTQAIEEGWKDTSQRMLNVMMKDTVVPIHRHRETSETVIVLRGSGDEVIYDSNGQELDRVKLRYGSDCAAVQVPRGTYHTFIPNEDGTVIFEAKDYMQGFHLAFFGTPFFREAIEAWTYGPVVPVVFQEFKKFKKRDINPENYVDNLTLTVDEQQMFDMVYSEYNKFSAVALVNMTHTEGPWKNHDIGDVITEEELRNFFLTQIEQS